MEKEIIVWSKILATVLKMPGAKLDRISFLRHELRPYCNQSRLQMIGSVRPYTVVSEEVVDRLARQCVRYHTTLATAASTVVGLPGGLAMAATLPADITQFFYHAVVLSQKLAYLYGYPDLFYIQEKSVSQENPDSQETSSSTGTQEGTEPSSFQGVTSSSETIDTDLLTIFLGVMMGAPVAENGLSELSKAVAENAVTRLPRVALTKTALMPIAAQVARLVGSRVSRQGLAKGIGRFIPLAGGLFSGGLTLITFQRGANRLRRQLRAQRHFFDDGNIEDTAMESIKASFVKAAQAERDPRAVQVAMIQAIINIAKINDEVSPEKYKVIEQRIARAKIDAQDKLELLGNIDSEKSYDVDFGLLAASPDKALEVYDAMVAIVGMGDKPTMAEKIYLNMVAEKLRVRH